MSYSFGKNFKITVFGQSHSKSIGVVIDGICAGYKINYDLINKNLYRRRPGKNKLSTSRNEKDQYEIISGEVNGITVGAPLCFIIQNKDYKSSDYRDLIDKPRPSHADYPAYIKYNGFNDIRGAGQFSGRMTAPLVIAGSIAQDLILNENIKIFSRIKSIKDVEDKSTNYKDIDFLNKKLKDNEFPVLDDDIKQKMKEVIFDAKKNEDSVGGVIETIILNMPIGVGEPMFDSIESKISSAVFSVPAVKGIEFGSGFSSTKMFGSEHNDEYYYEGDIVKTYTNNNGGISGGLTNSMPIVFRTAIKPTSSIGKIQNTISIKNKTNEKLKIKGRHDPSIVLRAVPVIDAVSAIAILDLILEGRK